VGKKYIYTSIQCIVERGGNNNGVEAVKMVEKWDDLCAHPLQPAAQMTPVIFGFFSFLLSMERRRRRRSIP
jgi:hypothetical protein